MKIGFGLPVSGSWATREHMARVATRAEELGYHSLWSFQRLLSPADGAWGEQYRSVHAPLIPLAYAAALTERIRLGVAVINLPFTNPAVLAKEVSSLDIVSGGRADLGLGIGWSDEEFTAVGVSKRGRGPRADDFLVALKAVWAGAPHQGRYYTVPPGVASDPKPVQRPHPPILLGGGSEATFRRAGRHADGWVSGSQMGPELIGAAVLAVRAAAEQAGRDPSALRFVVRGAVKVRPAGSPERKPLTGTLDEIRADLALYREIGVTELFVDLNFDPEIASPSADPAVCMRRAEQVLEAFAP